MRVPLPLAQKAAACLRALEVLEPAGRRGHAPLRPSFPAASCTRDQAFLKPVPRGQLRDMFRWTLAGIVVLAVAGAFAVTTLTTRDSSATTVTAKPSSAAVDRRLAHAARARRRRVDPRPLRPGAPCRGTATLANVAVPYRIAAGREARLRFAVSRTGRAALTWRETSGTIKYDSVTLRPS